MKYYKVKAEYDQRKRRDGSILIANELYTEKELKKYSIPEFTVETVNVAKTYWFFGARFQG